MCFHSLAGGRTPCRRPALRAAALLPAPLGWAHARSPTPPARALCPPRPAHLTYSLLPGDHAFTPSKTASSDRRAFIGEKCKVSFFKIICVLSIIKFTIYKFKALSRKVSTMRAHLGYAAHSKWYAQSTPLTPDQCI